MQKLRFIYIAVAVLVFIWLTSPVGSVDCVAADAFVVPAALPPVICGAEFVAVSSPATIAVPLQPCKIAKLMASTGSK